MGFLYNNFLTDLFCLGIDGLAGVIADYAVAIILMTIFIRLALMPVDIATRKNQAKMADLRPQLDNLQKRYANNPQLMQKKQKELYKKMAVKPLIGCLPMILQLFILFAFFGAMRALQSEQTMGYALEAMEYGSANVDINSFLWVHNLWQPDTVWPGAMPNADEFVTFLQSNADYITPQMLSMLETHELIDFTGSQIAIIQPTYASVMDSIVVNQGLVSENGIALANGICALPILAGVSMFLSSKFGGQQQNADPNQAGTNKMMMYIFPFFSAYICFTSNAAFALYWTVSSLYAFAQGRAIMAVLKRKKLKENKKTVTISNS